MKKKTDYAIQPEEAKTNEVDKRCLYKIIRCRGVQRRVAVITKLPNQETFDTIAQNQLHLG